MVVGDDVTYADFFDEFVKTEKLLNRPIHANFVSPDEWKRKLAQGSAFFTKINAQPKIFVVGSQEDLAASPFRNWKIWCAWASSNRYCASLFSSSGGGASATESASQPSP
jgi:hypothetical protein